MIEAQIREYNASTTASAAESIALTTTYNEVKRLNSVSVAWHGGTAPTSTEDLVVLIDSAKGATYDVELLRVDPAYELATDIVFIPDSVLNLAAGDEIAVTYANTDDLAVTVSVRMEAR